MAESKGKGIKLARGFKFDQTLESLEGLVEQLESGDLGLEEALKVFEKGVKLTRNCQQALDNAQQKVETLIEQSGIELDESLDEDADEWEDADD